MADGDTGRRSTRRSTLTPKAEEPSSPPKRSLRSAAMALQLSNEECLAQYNTFKTQDDFLNSFEKSVCEKFIRGAMKANKGSLPCMTCGKIVNTALGMVLHLNGRKCKAKTPEPEAENKETPVTERKRRRLAVKMEEPDDDDFIPEEPPVPVSEKPKRSRTVKKDKAIEVKSVQQLQDEPSLWMPMSDEEKNKFLTNFYGAGPYPCFAVKTDDKGDCGSFASTEEAIEHNNGCISPMYFTFRGERLALLRSLPKTLRARFVREALQLHKEVQCLECPRLFTHVYGLIYHIERCNVDQSVAPWKCYRCGHITTMANGQDHLSNCREEVAESDYVPGDRLKERMDTDDLPKIFGCLDDVNLRSGKAIEKNENAKVDAKAAVEKLVNMGIDIRMKRKATLKASVSAGVLPPESSRVRIVNSGVMRFRFRKAEITNTPTDLSGWDSYMAQMEEAVTTWTLEKRAAILCDPLIGFPTTAWPENDSVTLDFNKESSGFRFQESPGNFYPTSTLPPELAVLKNFSSTKFDDDATRGSWLSMAYCGGPVHTLKFAPNRLCPEEEVLLVCSFPDDSSLVQGNFRDCGGSAQLWIVRHNADSTSSLHPWVVIESNFGVILTACWLDIPRSEDDETFIGHLALGTSQGKVIIYSVDKQCLPAPAEKPVVLSPEPLMILRQSEEIKIQDNGEKEIVVHNPPITRLEWSSLDQAQFVAGVNAAGSVVFWDLTGNLSTPKFLRDPAWSSPAQDLCFAKEYELVVGFREKLVRVYDIRNWSCVLEENTVRTAGSRVISCPRSVSGFLTFQSEYFASGEVPATGIAYVCSDNIANGYFVVPLANRHDLQMWDASVSSVSGITATCGVDGQLLLSANGRVVPRQSKADCGFSVMRPSLLLTRRRLEEVPPEANKTRDCLFDYDIVCKRTWLDITVNPNKNSQTATYSSLELRNESLNAVATNHFGRPVVATAGQAGLIFLRSCAIDKDTAFDPLDIISSLVGQKSAPKKKQGRPRRKRDEDDD